jgi:prepilin-type N-terminal cleavage/methylation domain-containing protein
LRDVVQLKRDDRRRRDAGFTLVEVLITIVIMGFMTLPLGNLMVAYVRTTTYTAVLLNESHDAQVATAYFAQDVASVGRRDANDNLLQSVWQGATTSGAPYTCVVPSGSTPILLMAWDDFTSSGVRAIVEVAYVAETVTVGTRSEYRLVRVHCSALSTTTGTVSPDSTAVLAHNLYVPKPPPTPPPARTPPTTSCSTVCTAAAVPNTITMVMKIQDALDTGSTYDVTLTGQRRQAAS